MSHSHHPKHMQKEKPKKIKEELEQLQEARERAEEIKAELLEHNHLLKLHETAAYPEEPQEAEEEAAGGEASNENKNPAREYVKKAEDMKRSARMLEEADSSREEKPGMGFSPGGFFPGDVLAFQLQVIDAWTNAWSRLLSAGLKAYRPEPREEISPRTGGG